MQSFKRKPFRCHNCDSLAEHLYDHTVEEFLRYYEFDSIVEDQCNHIVVNFSKISRF